MEQILNCFLTTLKPVSGHLLLRANHRKLNFYEEEIRQWATSSNLTIKVVHESDSSFADSKLQLTSIVQYNNGRKTCENLYCGSYAYGVISFAVNMHHNKIDPQMKAEHIQPFQFITQPYIRITSTVAKSRQILELKKNRQTKQKCLLNLDQSVKEGRSRRITAKSIRKNRVFQDIPLNKQDKSSHGRKCYCCSHRSNEEDHLEIQGGFSRSPSKLLLQTQERKNSKSKSPKQAELLYKNHIEQQRQGPSLTLKDKSSTSDRNKSSPHLNFRTNIKANHQYTKINSNRNTNYIASNRNTNHKSTSGACNSMNTPSMISKTNTWVVKTKRNGGAQVRNSVSEDKIKTNVRIRIKDQEFIKDKGKENFKQPTIHRGLKRKSGLAFQSETAKSPATQEPISSETINKRYQHKQYGKLILNEIEVPQRFSQISAPIEENQLELDPIRDGESIPKGLGPFEEKHFDHRRSASNQNWSCFRQQLRKAKENDDKKEKQRSHQSKQDERFIKNNTKTYKDVDNNEKYQLNDVEEATKLKPTRMKKIPIAQKMQIIKQEHEKSNINAANMRKADVSSTHKDKQHSQVLKKKKIEPGNLGKKVASPFMRKQNSQSLKPKEQVLNDLYKKEDKSTQQIEQVQEKKINANYPEKMQQINEADDDFSQTQERILAKQDLLQSSVNKQESFVLEQQKERGSYHAKNDSAATVKEIDYEQQQINDIERLNMEEKEEKINTSRTIPIRPDIFIKNQDFDCKDIDCIKKKQEESKGIEDGEFISIEQINEKGKEEGSVMNIESFGTGTQNNSSEKRENLMKDIELQFSKECIQYGFGAKNEQFQQEKVQNQVQNLLIADNSNYSSQIELHEEDQVDDQTNVAKIPTLQASQYKQAMNANQPRKPTMIESQSILSSQAQLHDEKAKSQKMQAQLVPSQYSSVTRLLISQNKEFGNSKADKIDHRVSINQDDASPNKIKESQSQKALKMNIGLSSIHEVQQSSMMESKYINQPIESSLKLIKDDDLEKFEKDLFTNQPQLNQEYSIQLKEKEKNADKIVPSSQIVKRQSSFQLSEAYQHQAFTQNNVQFEQGADKRCQLINNETEQMLQINKSEAELNQQNSAEMEYYDEPNPLVDDLEIEKAATLNKQNLICQQHLQRLACIEAEQTEEIVQQKEVIDKTEQQRTDNICQELNSISQKQTITSTKELKNEAKQQIPNQKRDLVLSSHGKLGQSQQFVKSKESYQTSEIIQNHQNHKVEQGRPIQNPVQIQQFNSHKEGLAKQIRTIQVQTDELLSLKEFGDQKMIAQSSGSMLALRQCLIRQQTKQREKRKMPLCDPQFLCLSSSETTKRQANSNEARDVSHFDLRISHSNINFSQKVRNQSKKQQISHLSTKMIKEQTKSNEKTLNKEIKSSNLKMSKKDRQKRQSLLNYHQVEDDSYQIQQITCQNVPQNNKLTSKISDVHHIVNDSNPKILEKVISRKIREETFVPEKKSHEQIDKINSLIHNAFVFIDQKFPDILSQLVNTQNTKCCLFHDGQWILYKFEAAKDKKTALQMILKSKQSEFSIFKCIEMLSGMPMRLLKDKQQSSSNKKLLKSIQILLEKQNSNQYEQIIYSVNKNNSQMSWIDKMRYFLDQKNISKTILQCRSFKTHKQNIGIIQQACNIEAQKLQQFIQIHLLENVRYMTLQTSRCYINTYELELSNLVLYLNGDYKFIFYEERSRNQYKLIKETYYWLNYHCSQKMKRYLLIIEPVSDKKGQQALTLRFGLNSESNDVVYRLISSQKGGKAKGYQGGYENTTNLYLPVTKQIKGKE